MLSNRLHALKTRAFKLTTISNKKIHGFYFTVQPDTSNIVKGECVNVYQGPEYEELHQYLTNQGYYDIIPKSQLTYNLMLSTWKNCVFDTSFKAKYFGLLPFFFEDRNTQQAQKKFIIKMDIFPETKHFRFICVMASGLHTFYEPFNDVVPLPSEDFQIRHLMLRSRPPFFIDMDMLYANRKLPNIYCFDQKGIWNPEGVNHPMLKLENSYRENDWFDHYLWENMWL